MPLLQPSSLATAMGVGAWFLLAHLPSPPQAHASPAATAPAATQPAPVAPDDAMRRLRDGNQRFVQQRATHAHHDAARRAELAQAQHPFAIVLGCADSRVPPELLFDQGLGDLFVIRVAGEVAPSEVVGSVEYAVEHLHCRTVIVLGHQRCGAVQAAMDALAHHETTPPGDLGELIKEIEPSIEKIDRARPDAMDDAVKASARAVAGRLVTHSKVLAELVHTGEIVVTPAYYSLDTGKVEFMESPPTAAAKAAER